jgi:ribosome recycling factor
MSADSFLKQARTQMEKCREHLAQELKGIRSGRASPALVEGLKVEVSQYGSTMGLKELAGITVADGTTIVIKPYDVGTLKDISRAIEKSNLGINPQNDGKVIRLPVPPLSGERRNQLAQNVKQIAEQQKIAIRNVRRDINKAMEGEKNKTLTEDALKRGQDELQKVTDEFVKKIDQLVAEKTKEIMDS